MNDIPHVRSWVFYDKAKALAFCESSRLPIVVKTATGGGGSGVQIIKERSRLKKLVKLYFGRGFRVRSAEPYDRQRGFVFLQEYLEAVDEWRMVRIGDSYFGHRKCRASSGLHSGSGACEWENPDAELLDLLKDVTDKGGFRSMDVDVFATPGKKLLVNECQTVFGCAVATTQMKVDGVEGRYVRENGRWVFEIGGFCGNYMCDLRLRYLLRMLEYDGSSK
jgi:glutathione synthase/RimK-type ligase-like ATP-grasp enzyme